MRTAALGFALGAWLLQRQAALPETAWLIAGALGAIAALAGAWLLDTVRPEPFDWAQDMLVEACLEPSRKGRTPGGTSVRGSTGSPRTALSDIARFILTFASFLILGFSWAAFVAQVRLAERLDLALEGRDVAVTGVIAGLPQSNARGMRFDFDVEAAPAGVPRHIALSLYEDDTAEEIRRAPRLRAGERWRFTVRLRRPHGNANPHGFDYEVWLLERGIRAVGYVRLPARAAVDEKLNRRANAAVAGSLPERIDEFVFRPQYFIERLREAARERIRGALPDAPYAGVIVALAVGDQNAISSEEWQLFARTGVSHLMSISGLHITMVAGLFAVLASFGWRRSERLMLALPAQKAAALAGFLAAFAYCLISGFAVPAQRTLYMVGVVALALWHGRASSGSRVLALALLVVLVLDPWAVLAPGFWLSFGAVALIFYVGAGRTERPHWLSQWGRVQWAVTVGLAPLLLVLFRQVSLVSPLANAIAIPLVSFVITPLSLICAALPFDAPLALAQWLLRAMMAMLEWMSSLPNAVWRQHAPVFWTLPIALLGIVWMLLPRGWPSRWLGVPLMLPMFLVAPAGPGAGELWLTVLDVGQGLAVLARTEKHALLFDAGPSFGEGADSGNRIVVPYLRGEGIDQLDALVVSHDDSDHSGGAQSVMDAIPTGMLWASLPEDHALLEAPVVRLPCAAGRGWYQDGVRFDFLHPAMPSQSAQSMQSKGGRPERINNRSCVLRVANSGGSALITGDIERAAERELLERSPAALAADVLIVPHHGSRTSSSPEFVRAVAPRYAVFTVGYRNRFGHPREDVLARYREVGSRILRTDETGALQLRFPSGGGVQVVAQRDAERRYWHAG